MYLWDSRSGPCAVWLEWTLAWTVRAPAQLHVPISIHALGQARYACGAPTRLSFIDCFGRICFGGETMRGLLFRRLGQTLDLGV